MPGRMIRLRLLLATILLAAFAAPAAAQELPNEGQSEAAFLAFLMSICNKRYAAAQYALLSAAFGLGRTLVGFRSGTWAEDLGYAPYFLLTFALAFPAFLLLPWVKKLKDSIPPEDVRAAAA